MLQSEPLLLGTPLEAQSSELGIPVARRGGPTGTDSKDLKDKRVLIMGRKEARSPRSANGCDRAKEFEPNML